MFQFRRKLIGLLATGGLLLMSAIPSTPALYAADEDIDIPYTDTYGYVYDPATGTYIKQDPTSTPDTPITTPTSTDTTTTTSVTGTATNTNTNLSATVVPSTMGPEQASPGIAVLLLPGLLIAAVFTGLIITRKSKKQDGTQP